ncbi:MAG TPA: 4Fe-4S binding protein, partial [Armatimonadota bacterium]|nr:4Fe-4S binding protein [Armatimonadota bacterium]
IGGWFYPYLGLLLLICMISPIIVGGIRGRYWCGWMCPRGAFFDYIMSRFSRNRPIPAWMRCSWFRLLVVVVLMGMMGVQLAFAWPIPTHIGRVFVLLLGVTTVIGIVLSLAFSPRAWCMICPMGTIASWISGGKDPLATSTACTQCRLCEKACPMKLTPYNAAVSQADCLKCQICVINCPKQALSFGEIDKDFPHVREERKAARTGQNTR